MVLGQDAGGLEALAPEQDTEVEVVHTTTTPFSHTHHVEERLEEERESGHSPQTCVDNIPRRAKLFHMLHALSYWPRAEHAHERNYR